MLLRTTRQHLKFIHEYTFTFVQHWKLTRLNNISHLGRTTAEVLAERVFHCLLDEIDIIFKKKLVNTAGVSISLKLSTAQGITLYRLLLMLPVPEEGFFFNHIRNEWIKILDQQLVESK